MFEARSNTLVLKQWHFRVPLGRAMIVTDYQHVNVFSPGLVKQIKAYTVDLQELSLSW